MIRYYNRKNEPISCEEWSKLLEQSDYRRIEETTLNNGNWISTVWLGLNYHFTSDLGSPLIFKTMVFLSEDNLSESLDIERYTTEVEAYRGHEKMVQKWIHKEEQDAHDREMDSRIAREKLDD